MRERSSAADYEREAAVILERFEGVPPLVEDGPSGPTVSQRALSTRQQRTRAPALTNLHVLVFSDKEGKLVRLTLPFWLYDPDLHPLPLQHVFSGALVLAAFFIATDPVSGCTTPRGRLWFGAGVAVLTLAIRRWGAFPDGVAFAVLLMNCAAPWIDAHTRPRILGEAPRR